MPQKQIQRSPQSIIVRRDSHTDASQPLQAVKAMLFDTPIAPSVEFTQSQNGKSGALEIVTRPSAENINRGFLGNHFQGRSSIFESGWARRLRMFLHVWGENWTVQRSPQTRNTCWNQNILLKSAHSHQKRGRMRSFGNFLCIYLVSSSAVFAIGDRGESFFTPFERWRSYAGPQPSPESFEKLNAMYSKGPFSAELSFYFSFAARTGVIKSESIETAKALKESAEAGYAPAQAVLGWAEVTGATSGIPKSVDDGIRLINASMTNNDPSGNLAMGLYLSQVDKSPTGLIKARGFFASAATGGLNQALAPLALLDGILNRNNDAVTELQKGADSGDGNAQYILSSWYEDGHLLPTNLGLAEKWLCMASEDVRCKIGAHYLLGKFYERNDEIADHASKAFRSYQKAATEDVRARYKVAVAELFGNGTHMHTSAGISLLREVADEGYSDAEFDLASCYLEGVLVPRDQLKARALLEAAASQDNAKAKAVLNWLKESQK